MKKELLIALLLGAGGLVLIFLIILGRPVRKPQTPNAMETQATPAATSEVASHNTPDDCWVTVNGVVYDVTSYIPDHPAGPESIERTCGGDATEAFETRNGKGPHSEKSSEQLSRYRVETN